MPWQRTSPISMLQNFARFIYILILPLLQGLFLLPYSDSPLQTVIILEIAAVLLITALSALKWRRLKFCVENAVLILESGLYILKVQHIPLVKISSIDYEAPLWLGIFGLVRIRADTASGGRAADVALILRRARALDLIKTLESHAGHRQIPHKVNSFLRLAIMAISLSSAGAGVVFVVPLVNNAGKILGQEFADRIYGAFSDAYHLLSVYIPSTAAIAAAILAVGWVFAFLRVFLRHARFIVKSGDHSLSVSAGLIFRRKTILRKENINAMDLRQSLFMRLFRLWSCYVLCSGYGKEKGERAIIVPAEAGVSMNAVLDCILPFFVKRPVVGISDGEPNYTFIHIPKRGLWGYISLPVIALAVLPLILYCFYWLFPHYSELIPTVAAIVAVPMVWRLLMSIVAFRHAGIVFYDDRVTLCTLIGFVLHRVTVSRNKIVRIGVNINISQKKSGLCNVNITVFGEKAKTFVVRNIPYDQLSRVKMYLNQTQDNAKTS